MLVLSIILGSVFIQLYAQDFNKQRCAIDISSLWPAEGLNRNYSMHELKGNVKSVECTMKEAIILDGDTTYNGVTPESYDIVSQRLFVGMTLISVIIMIIKLISIRMGIC